MSSTRVIKIAVLVTADVRPKDLPGFLDEAFEDVDEVLQFVVEGHGWEKDGDATEAALMATLIDDVADRLGH
jgi:hypothetical protein